MLHLGCVDCLINQIMAVLSPPRSSSGNGSENSFNGSTPKKKQCLQSKPESRDLRKRCLWLLEYVSPNGPEMSHAQLHPFFVSELEKSSYFAGWPETKVKQAKVTLTEFIRKNLDKTKPDFYSSYVRICAKHSVELHYSKEKARLLTELHSPDRSNTMPSSHRNIDNDIDNMDANFRDNLGLNGGNDDEDQDPPMQEVPGGPRGSQDDGGSNLTPSTTDDGKFPCVAFVVCGV